MKVSKNYLGINFEWDSVKAETNLAKHHVSFEQAMETFSDPMAYSEEDEDHSWEEDRLKLIGADRVFKILLVCYCYREENNKIRIISARKATPQERKEYENRNKEKHI